ncbi:MAG: hypothetical protein ACFFDN_32090, partial [Candidatus Hodarchaeota archaeon]
RFRNYDNDLDPWDFVKIKNYLRRDLTTAQRAALGLEDLKIEKKKAKLRKARTQLNGKTKDNKPKLKISVSHPGSPTEDDQEKGKAIDIVAKKWRIAPKSLRKAKKIVETAKRNKEVKENWDRAKNNEISLEEVYRKAKEVVGVESSIRKEKYTNSKKISGEKRKPKFCRDCPNIEKVNCIHCKKINLLCNATKIPVVKKLYDKACFRFNNS